MSVVVWFRKDLRTEANPALIAAAETGEEIIPVFIWAPEEEDDWAPGAASKVFQHYALIYLKNELKKLGLDLIIRQGNSQKILEEICEQTNAKKVFWNRRYEPYIIERDKKIKESLKEKEIETESFNGSLLADPWEVLKQTGTPFKVYTAYYNNYEIILQRIRHSVYFPELKKQKAYNDEIQSESIESLDLLPERDWKDGIISSWNLNEENGCASFKKDIDRFIKVRTSAYGEFRDRPDLDGVSKISPYLHFGLISPTMIYQKILKEHPNKIPDGTQQYVKQLIWRDFAHHLLYHFPQTVDKALYPKFEAFPWQKDPEAFKRWCQGKTGFALVDAGMRELWHTGWMHNRVRMMVGSFLVKHLLIDWREGARWFWDTLVDADLANNTLGWQWIAGCGADASPYFRIFNPHLQLKKFDPDLAYCHKWIPEFDTEDYPKEIISHEAGRDRAMQAYEVVKGKPKTKSISS